MIKESEIFRKLMQQATLSRIIFFGLQFDDQTYAPSSLNKGGISHLGPREFLKLLESYLGSASPYKSIDHLRIEEFRQALYDYLAKMEPEAFFRKAFEADSFSTCIRLLEMRDELAGAGWDFQLREGLPSRLETLARIESFLNKKESSYLSIGVPDRINRVISQLSKAKHPIEEVHFFEPFHLLPPEWKRLLKKLEESGTLVQQKSVQASAPPESDLGIFQRILKAEEFPDKKTELRADGSLLILRSRRDTDAATFLAKLSKNNSDFQPVFLIPEKKRTLDNAFVVEGLPSMGVLSSSSARPSLQLLKLAPTFLWEPVDPVSILEFASLPMLPLPKELARRIARSISRTPGLNNAAWEAGIRRYFGELKANSQEKEELKKYKSISREFSFWFKRKRYPRGAAVPASEVIELYNHLADWAEEASREGLSASNTLVVLQEQSRQIVELLETFPGKENTLSPLELERLVRTIYESSPLEYQAQQCGHCAFFHHPGAAAETIPELVWWSFLRKDPDHFFSSWYISEREYLSGYQIELPRPEERNQLQLWYYQQPLFQASRRALLIIPDSSDGKEAYPHTLHDFLLARIESPEAITFHIDKSKDIVKLPGFSKSVQKQKLPVNKPPRPEAWLQLRPRPQLGQLDQASPTDLRQLFYYPHQWFFKRKTKFLKSPLLSIPEEQTLLGNLAHRFFEVFLLEDFYEWEKEALEDWTMEAVEDILRKEGAGLLLYGREPDKADFIHRLKHAAWTFASLVRNNRWRVAGTELPLSRAFYELPVRGKTDLLLEREDERVIVDFKWGGASRRENQIRNEEDLQLILYAHLLGLETEKIHTAYFIIRDARMIARNGEAFSECTQVSPDDSVREVHERVIRKMKDTLDWRIQQLDKGFLELRNKENAPLLDEKYGDILLELLEMKDKDDPWDDYQGLLH
jgi:ATP-dependent helicase/nuclease subunit B